MNLRWFISKTVRHATAMQKHVRNILNSQRDILSPQAFQAVDGSLTDLNRGIHSDTKKDVLLKQMEAPRNFLRQIAFYRLPYLPPLWIRPEAC